VQKILVAIPGGAPAEACAIAARIGLFGGLRRRTHRQTAAENFRARRFFHQTQTPVAGGPASRRSAAPTARSFDGASSDGCALPQLILRVSFSIPFQLIG